MSLEGSKGPDKRRSGVVEAAAFATALLGAVDSGPAQALEITQGTSWNIAVTQNIRNAVMREKNESATTFLKIKNGPQMWPSVISGEANNVEYDSLAEMRHVQKSARGQTIEVRCSFHTHPVQKLKDRGIKYPIPYTSPSPEDVGVENAQAQKQTMSSYALMGSPVEKNVFAVADMSGIWYYESTTADRITPENLAAWGKIYNDFHVRSVFDKNFDFVKEYPNLQEAYRTFLKAEVRFVSYNDVPNEPVCAGVHYVPGKIKQSYDIKVNQSTSKVASEVAPPQSAGRPSLKDLDESRGRRRLDDDGGPRIIEVGPPQR